MSKYLRVLIADIDKEDGKALGRLSVWEDNGFAVFAYAADTAEVVRICREKGADLVVCRHGAPKMIAPEVMRAVIKNCGDTAFIIISPTDDSEYMRECFLLGAVDYLVEPFADIKLNGALQRAKNKLRSPFEGREYVTAVNEFFGELPSEIRGDKFTLQIKEFILGSESRIATTEYAADSLGFNKDYFGRLFKQKLGMTFGDFYKRFRIRYAEKLLMSGRYKVAEVSEITGFASVDYFTTIFKKITGRKPSEFKRR